MISFPNIMLSVLQGLPLHIKRVNCRVVYSMMYFQLSDDLLWSEESENRCGFFLPCATLLALIFSRHNLMIITDICLAVIMLGFPGGSDNKRNCLQCRRPRFNPWVGRIPWRRERLPTPVFWPGEFHGLYYSPGGGKESDTTERLSLFLCYMRGFMLQCYMHDFRKILQKSH